MPEPITVTLPASLQKDPPNGSFHSVKKVPVPTLIKSGLAVDGTPWPLSIKGYT